MSSHQCRVSTAVNKIPVPATGMSHPGHAQVSSVRKAKAWAALAKAAAFLGCQQRPEAIPRPWRKGEISARRPPHPHSAEASLFKATSHHQHMEGLQGFAFWVTGGQIWSAPTQLKFLSNTETFPWTKTTSAALASQPHWAGLNCHWADHYLCLFNEQRSKELRWQSLEDRHASYISFALDKIQ